MTIAEIVSDILDLQSSYTSSNTEPMKTRGLLVRHSLPQALEPLRAKVSIQLGIGSEELVIEGRDGTGLKSEVPWVRLASRTQSPSATTGWYIVWLHRRDGAGVYLTLAHGSTTFVAGALIARSDDELRQLMEWGRSALGPELNALPRLTTKIDLATRAPLAVAYEKSSLAAFFYPRSALPSDEQTREDVLAMASLLGRLYEAERLGQTPLSVSPEILDATSANEAISKPTKVMGGQGFGLSAAERTAVELRAMALATAYFSSIGYAIKDVSREGSFDLLGTKGTDLLTIEVKGTTGAASAILLTKNEVSLHKQCFPHNALAVVHGITLHKDGILPSATGGSLIVKFPWLVDDARLEALSFAYKLID